MQGQYRRGKPCIEKNEDFPKVGDTVEFEGLFKAKVLEMEGLRVVKVLVTPEKKEEEES